MTHILDTIIRIVLILVLFGLLVLAGLCIQYALEEHKKQQLIRRDNPLSRNTHQHKDH